ncbi:MAG: tripartite tricarboxylate transporter substrate binding protein [Burkholderiaceae bacterium]|nr:tripartite tricarboxylate transporter substrate binding protein [Burkholderiaceae bacterium]
MLKKSFTAVCFLAALMSVPLAAQADTYPTRPIRVVIPFASGGTTDVLARLLAAKLGESLKQTVNVDSRPGANGIIGTDIVAKAAPDGYTLLMTVASTQTLVPSLYKLPYDPLKDLVPISLVANLGGVFVVNAAVPARTMQEFIAQARTKPGHFSFAAGTSLIRLIGEQFKQTIGADITMVPYKGTGPQLAAVVGGEVQATVDPFVSMPFIKSGKVRALAVLLPRRSALLPDVPTLEETGIKGITLDSWAALMAPAGTPADIVQRLSAEVARIVAQPELRERLATLNYEPVGSTPAELAKAIETDTAKWRRVVKESNYKAED